MLTTPICRTLGIQHPIFLAGMGGGVAGSRLAAAVSNAGGFGVLGMSGLPPTYIAEQIRETRALTDKPIGVNLLLPLLEEGQIQACLSEHVEALVLFWGDPAPHIQLAHEHDTKVIVQVGCVADAIAAAQAGADALIVQGVEAGGHVQATTGLATNLPAVVDAVAPLPVIAAGGIADGRSVAAALVLGAQGVSMGTRFLASDEAVAARGYKQRVVAARAEDTVRTKLFDGGWPNAMHRVLRNAAFNEWEAAGQPPSGQRPREGEMIGRMPVAGAVVDIPRYNLFMPLPGFTGDIDDAALYAGESCARVNSIRPAGELVTEIVDDAERALNQTSA